MTLALLVRMRLHLLRSQRLKARLNQCFGVAILQERQHAGERLHLNESLANYSLLLQYFAETIIRKSSRW
jgi:hypothetical protein